MGERISKIRFRWSRTVVCRSLVVRRALSKSSSGRKESMCSIQSRGRSVREVVIVGGVEFLSIH